MAWQLLAAALPAAAKIAGTALSKPRQEDYSPQTDYMKKYLSYLRGRSLSREVMHQAMQPALRVAGKQGRQMQRQVGYDVAKSGLGGSGIEAQMRLSAGQQTQEALATATGKAVAAQTAATARVGEQAAGIMAQIGAEEARADQAFKSAESQWKRQLAGDVIGGAASLASAGISQYGENIAGFRQAVMDESIPAGTTYSQFKGMAKGGVIEGAPELGVPEKAYGSVSPSEFSRLSGAAKQQISGLKLAEEMVGTQKVLDMRKRGISDADIISNAKRMQSMYVSAVGAGQDPVLIRQAMQMGGFGSQTSGSVSEGDDPEQGIFKDIKEKTTKKGGESKVSMEPTFGKYKGQRIEKGTPEYEEHIKSQEWKDYLSGKIDKDGNKVETSDVINYKQGKGLTKVANNKLYAEDPTMLGKSPEEIIKRYEELFINNLASL